MMPDLDAIYDKAFFAQWGRSNEPYMRSAEVITETLIAQLKPKRIADIGCGCAVYTHAFAQRGVSVFALDGVKPSPEHSFPVPVHVQDLTVPFDNVWGHFDFALCLEVAEHIPEEMSDAFLDNLVRFSDTIVLSAAPPNQGGHHHVNERPKRYWVSRLAERGFAYNRPKSGRVFESVIAIRPPNMWMVQHLSVYERTSDTAALKRMLPFSVRLSR